MAWLQKKLGLFVGYAVYWVGTRLYAVVSEKVAEWIAKWRRDRQQKKATEKLEENVQELKPIDDGTRKDEEEYLNS